jgi:thiol-disulfide isomerase/thioredoxin
METLAEPIGPDDIDLAFVAQVVPELEVADLGDERVVLGGTTQLVVLNPTAALIFQFLDGEATLGELVDDFTEALDVDRSVVEADVLAFARDLGANGLLEGVELPRPELPEGFEDLDWSPTDAIAVGDELDDFTLPDLDGTERSLSEFRGRRTLLVNWSPTCGFCVKIAEELAALDPVLDEHDVQLLLVTSGDAESNRAVHDQYRLAAPTLLRIDTDVDPFAGTGTPAAYLIAEDGTLAESMAVGADQVRRLARDLAGVDPATPYGEVAELTHDEADGDEVRGRYLPAPGAMCGPGGGAGASNSTDWLGTRVYALGGYHVGLRYDDADTADVLDRLFPGARVNDRRAPDNYSVALGGTPTTKGAGTSRSLKLLVHGSTQLVRSRSGGRVLAALLQQLSGDIEPADPSLLQVNATAAVRDGEALLLPPGLVGYLKQLQPRLAKAGIGIVDVPRTLLDLDARELVVPEPAVPHDASVVEGADAGVKLGSELPWIRPGRYPLRAWFLVRSPEHVGRLSPGVAVATAITLLYELDDLRSQVERVAELFGKVEPVGLWYESLGELVDQVVAAL